MKLHHGPLWSVAPSMQSPTSVGSSIHCPSAKRPVSEVTTICTISTLVFALLLLCIYYRKI